MATTTIYTTKDASMYEPNDGWSGWDDHHPVGLGSGRYRSVIYFPMSFSGWTAVSSATLWVRGHRAASGNHVYGDATVTRTLYCRRITSDWGEGTNRGETLWSSQEVWGWNNRATAIAPNIGGSRVFASYSHGTWYSIDVTDIVQDWFSGSPNYGIMLYNSNESNPDAGLEFYARDAGTGYKPYLEVTYSTNTAPVAPTGLTPTADTLVNTLAPTLIGTRSDPDAGDYITAYQILLYQDDGTTLVWDSGTLTTTGTPTTFSKVYNGTALSGGTFYKWKARTRDKGAAWGPYSALQRFKVNSAPNPPNLALTETPASDINTLTPTLNITHSDNDASDVTMHGYRVLLETSTGAAVWDSGDIDISGSPVSFLAITYAGPALAWQTSYRWTARTKDQNGVWGNYATYQTFATHTTATPVNLNPTAGEVISGLVPTFSGERGSSSDTITSYNIVLFGSDQITLIWDSGNLTTGIAAGSLFSKVYDGTALGYGGVYFWKVRVTGSIGGISPFSALQSFATAGDASSPTQNLPTPNNSPTNSNVTSLTPTFTGARATAFTDYQIQLYPSTATSADPGTPIWDSGTLSQSSSTTFTKLYDGPALSWGTTYKWRVRVGAPTFGAYTGLAAFTLDAAGVPTLTAPTNGLWITTSTPTLTGNTSGGESAIAFRIRLYESDAVTLKWDSGDIAQGAATSFSKVYDGPTLAGGYDYHWEARYSKAGPVNGAYSPKFRFHVNSAPLIPTSLEPTPGMTNPDLFPTFKAYFDDPEKASLGDYPLNWVIELRDNATDALIQTKTITTGLVTGLNSYTWTGGDTALAYGVEYKWRTYFTDSKSAVGVASSYQVFKNAQAGVVNITAPTNGSNISTTRPTITWTVTGATQAKFRVKIIRVLNGTVAYDSGYRVAATSATTIPTGYLSRNTEYYDISVTVIDTNGLESNTDTIQVELQLDAPPRIEGLSATVNDETSSITLDWDASALATAFVTYVVYRRKVGEDDWGMIGTTKPEANTSFIDYYAGQTVSYEYRVTVVKRITAEPDIESPDSDIVTAALESDVWFVVGRDRSSEHIFELFVVSENHTRPVQQEVFEPLGTNRKTVTRGFVLGYEGSFTVTWQPEEKAMAEAQVDYLLYDAGPHILKNPFGDVYDVTFGTPDGEYRQLGIQDMTLTWIEIGQNTHNPTLTPDEFLAQIGAT